MERSRDNRVWELKQMSWRLVTWSPVHEPDVELTDDEDVLDYFFGTIIVLDLVEVEE